MKKIRVGIWLNEDMKPEAGGGFSYYSQLIGKINEYTFKDAEIIFLSKHEITNTTNPARYYTLQWKQKKVIRFYLMIKKLCDSFDIGQRFFKYCFTKIKENQQELYKELDTIVDVIYYTTPGCEFPSFPYIYTHWDLGHLSMFAFPEVSMYGAFESRKNLHDFTLMKALMIFTESNAGKQETLNYLNINENRIKVVPLFPSSLVEEKIIPKKPENIDPKAFFIHYSAQFWAHKNHYNLLLAFDQIKNEFPNLQLVLTGSDKGNKNYITELIKTLELTNKIIDLGFLELEELKWIYLNSQGLVMPTFLGPTNMPVLEAAELNCPVACSNLKGHFEQLRDYGYYFNPDQPIEMAEQIRLMITDKQKGIIKPYVSEFNTDNTMKAIDNAFSDLRKIRFCWGTN